LASVLLFSVVIVCGGLVLCCVVTFVLERVGLQFVEGVWPAALGSVVPLDDIP